MSSNPTYAMKNWKGLLLTLLAVLAASYTAAYCYFGANQVRLIFKPMKSIHQTPDQLGMEYEELMIPVGSGSPQGDLHSFWIPSKDPNTPAFLYLHGNNSTIGNQLKRSRRLHDLD